MKMLYRPQFFRFAILAILGVALVASFFIVKASVNKKPEMVAESTASTPSTDPLASMLQPVQGVVGDKFDAKYVELLLAHNAIGTAMADLVKDSQDKEIRDVATYITNANASNNEKLLAWAKAWGVDTNPPKQSDIDTIVANLTSNTGEERNHQFVLDIMDHFSGSITLSKLAISNSDNEEIKTFANQLITDVSAQGETLQKWAPTVSFDNDDRRTLSHNKHDDY